VPSFIPIFALKKTENGDGSYRSSMLVVGLSSQLFAVSRSRSISASGSKPFTFFFSSSRAAIKAARYSFWKDRRSAIKIAVS
jgi:hypothetical protein